MTKRSMNTDEQRELLKHLRLIHFTLLAACIAITIILFTSEQSRIGKAQEDVHAISGVLSTIPPLSCGRDWYYYYINYITSPRRESALTSCEQMSEGVDWLSYYIKDIVLNNTDTVYFLDGLVNDEECQKITNVVSARRNPNVKQRSIIDVYYQNNARTSRDTLHDECRFLTEDIQTIRKFKLAWDYFWYYKYIDKITQSANDAYEFDVSDLYAGLVTQIARHYLFCECTVFFELDTSSTYPYTFGNRTKAAVVPVNEIVSAEISKLHDDKEKYTKELDISRAGWWFGKYFASLDSAYSYFYVVELEKPSYRGTIIDSIMQSVGKRDKWRFKVGYGYGDVKSDEIIRQLLAMDRNDLLKIIELADTLLKRVGLEFTKKALIVPFKHKRYYFDVLDPIIKGASEMYHVDWKKNKFDETFVELASLETSHNLKYAELEGLLSEFVVLEELTEGSVSIAGIEMPRYVVGKVSIFVLLIIQLYMLVHLKRAVTIGKSTAEVPWMGMYDDFLSHFLSALTICILPVFVGIYAMGDATLDIFSRIQTSKADVLINLSLLLLSMYAAFRCWVELRKLRKKRN
jgi:hypothetical protein